MELDSNLNQSSLQDVKKTQILSANTADSWDVFHELTIVSQISRGKYPIFQAVLTPFNLSFALKVFPYKEGKISQYYLNEIKFMDVSHKHVIKYIKSTDIWYNNFYYGKNSYILTELATYGDFQQLVAYHHIKFNEILLRTYFHQLISGLEYLHNKGIAHLDLKPENLLLDESFDLKIADFDLAYKIGDTYIRSKGSKHYKAPELESKTCIDPMASDIYSVGVIIFVLLSRGIFPFSSDLKINDRDMSDLLRDDPEKFWEVHGFLKKRTTQPFQNDFKEIFIMMTQSEPTKRPSIKSIKETKWYNGRIYTEGELSKTMDQLFLNGREIKLKKNGEKVQSYSK